MDADLGKVDAAFFSEYLYPNLGADRDDVTLGPTHGVDFGVVDVGGKALVVATDPVSVLPRLGFDRAARFALDIILADVAVSGLAPTHLTVSLSLPPDFDDDEFATFWRAWSDEAEELGVAIAAGHTARYADSAFPWVGAATALAVGDFEDLVRPDGARPGDDLLVTKGPAVETTGLLTSLFPDEVPLSGSDLETAQARLDEAGAVRDARAISDAARGDVHAMHDATEGGLLGAFFEMADAAGVRFDVDTSAVPWRPGVRETSDALGFDPWTATTAGTLVVAVDPARTDDVVDALERRGTPVGVVGSVVAGEGVTLDGNPASKPRGDSSWPVYAALADRATDDASG
ncbi:hydrogenase expression protein [Salinigranum rubrum]|uniref:Hydrogenase expression protein n=1 Tax=Salinigranum rubrum TaxID=755307 RepID=A0A2I8VL77_9EURY|nr:AIR synthase family protein [Salinigranum rubrum]AUV82690.1 hydrogenase expression protein [Salinigranum rubrum]